MDFGVETLWPVISDGNEAEVPLLITRAPSDDSKGANLDELETIPTLSEQLQPAYQFPRDQRTRIANLIPAWLYNFEEYFTKVYMRGDVTEYLRLYIRGALDEERRAQKALILLKARDNRIASLERKIAEFENGDTENITSVIQPHLVKSASSFCSTGEETHYLSLPPSESFDSTSNEVDIFLKNDEITDQSVESKVLTKIHKSVSIPNLKLPTTSSSSERDAVILRGVKSDFNDNSSLTSDDVFHDESSVNLVVTTALAFSKFDDVFSKYNNRVEVSKDRQKLKSVEEKKIRITGPQTKVAPAGLDGMKLCRQSTGRHFKRGVEKTKEHDVLNRNLQAVQKGVDTCCHKESAPVTKSNPFSLEKQKVEDKVVHEDEQEAASPDQAFQLQGQIGPTGKCSKIDVTFPFQSPLSEHEASSTILSDELARQSLIEEALNGRGRKFQTSKNLAHRSDEIAERNNYESIICDLEKKLSATRVELTDALSEQRSIKNKYKRVLRVVEIAGIENRNDIQEKLLKMCASVLEKCGQCALINDRVDKQHRRKHQRPLQHFGKLSANRYKKFKNANRTSTKLKQQVSSTKMELDKKAQEYKSLEQYFENLKIELTNATVNAKDLEMENISLRKQLNETQEWIGMRVSKERHEKTNAVQFREIQRSRELSNLKKKSEQDVAELRSKLLRVESANSNKGFLLGNYKNQLADLSKDNDKLTIKIKELETENSLLRSNNAQLKASVTLINDEKERITTKTETSETEMMERIQSKLTIKYERSMLQKIDAMKSNYDKVVESMETKLRSSENLVAQYFSAIKLFLKQVDDYYRELDTLTCSEASEREAHETACSILNLTPSELSGFLKGRPPKTINSWLSELQKITSNKIFAEELGKLLFARAIDSAKN